MRRVVYHSYIKLQNSIYSQGPKVFPQRPFSIDFNAFSCLHEHLLCFCLPKNVPGTQRLFWEEIFHQSVPSLANVVGCMARMSHKNTMQTTARCIEPYENFGFDIIRRVVHHS